MTETSPTFWPIVLAIYLAGAMLTFATIAAIAAINDPDVHAHRPNLSQLGFSLLWPISVPLVLGLFGLLHLICRLPAGTEDGETNGETE